MKRHAPMLSTGFSEPAKSAKSRFSNILNTKKRPRAAGLFSFTCAAFILCGLCVACTDASIGIIGGADGPTSIFVTKGGDNQIKELYNARVKYIGNASAVGKLISLTPFMNGSDGMELYTSEAPYGIGVYTHATELSETERDMYRRAAAVLICLIDNADYAQTVNRDTGAVLCSFTRSELEEGLDRTLREYAESYDNFYELIQILLLSDKPEPDPISTSIFEQTSGGFLEGECAAEGHVILGSEDKDGSNVLYLLTTAGQYGFENDRFVKISGTGLIPVRLTIAPDGSVSEYLTPKDGSYWLPSLKEMFPQKYVDIVLNDKLKNQYYSDCTAQEEAYARAYLNSIGRRAPIGYGDNRDELYPLDNMNTEASNELGELFYDYPYWLGTQEKIENGVRYVYEKSWQDNGGGNGVVTYKKYEYSTSFPSELYVIEVNGSKLNYLEGSPRTGRK